MIKMTKLKIYEKLTAVKLKDGRIITTEASVKDVAEMLNNNDFVIIWDVGFWKYEVKSFEEFEPTEIDSFIYIQSSPKKDRLMQIIKEREEKHFITDSIEHLMRIYENRYWKKD